MSRPSIRRRASSIRQQWSSTERKRRAEISRRRCADLLASFEVQANENASLWAGGAMTISDLARIAG